MDKFGVKLRKEKRQMVVDFTKRMEMGVAITYCSFKQQGRSHGELVKVEAGMSMQTTFFVEAVT